MQLTRREIVEGVFTEYEEFAVLVAPLTDGDWDASTRCEGWCVRDVAAHVLGTAIDVTGGRVGSRSADEQASALRVRGPSAVADDLRAAAARLRPAFDALDEAAWAAPGPLPGESVGDAVRTLWYDTVVHADDIRAALGRPSARGTGVVAALDCVVARLRRTGWGPARLALDGTAEVAIGAGGPVLRGDPWQFVLVAAGRADPATFGLDDRVNIYR